MTGHSTTTIWVLIGVIGLGTQLIRLSFLAILNRVETIPPMVGHVLRLIPAAVMAAIVVPGFTHAAGTFDLGTHRFLAGAIATVVAWRTRNVLATIGVGMTALWLLEALV